MATKNSLFLGIKDLLTREIVKGKFAKIIEILADRNPILDDALTTESNMTEGHKTTTRTGLPEATWHKAYGGVQSQKSITMQVIDTAGELEVMSEIDARLVNMNGHNINDVRMSESEPFIEALKQKMATTMFYGDTKDTPEGFMGLAPRYSVISTDPTESGFNIVDAGGTGSDNTSAWFVDWDGNSCHLFYPKGSKAGIDMVDPGNGKPILKAAPDGQGDYNAYVTFWYWSVGLTVRDWRSCARVANLDVSLMAAGSVAIDDFLLKAYYKTFSYTKGRTVIYCAQEVVEALHIIAKDKVNVNLTLDTFEGKQVTSFMGIPVKITDAILTTEARVV